MQYNMIQTIDSVIATLSGATTEAENYTEQNLISRQNVYNDYKVTLPYLWYMDEILNLLTTLKCHVKLFKGKLMYRFF